MLSKNCDCISISGHYIISGHEANKSIVAHIGTPWIVDVMTGVIIL